MNKVESTISTDQFPILLFDGVCSFCNSTVQFIIKRDPHANVRFAALQSEVGQQLLAQFKLDPTALSTAVWIENNKAYTKADVGLKASRYLNGLWPLATIFYLIPRPLRNRVYNLIATNRYRWFGKKDQCMIPTPEIRSRFLDFN